MKRREFLVASGAAVSLGIMGRSGLYGQADGAARVRPPGVEFRPLRRNTGIFVGRGGTIGWLANKDGLVSVDTQFPETAEIFLAEWPGRDGRQIDAVVDTHHHSDHTSGNKVLKPAARMIVAHANVPALQIAAAERDPSKGEQTVADTLFERMWDIQVGDEVVSARHFGAGHTGGDVIVHFEEAGVVHMGDLVFNRIYPVTDQPGGCSLRGWIGVLEEAATLYPADARYVFGHANPRFGVVGGQGELLQMRDYLSGLLAHVEKEIIDGKSKEEIVALENLPGFDDYHVPAGRGNRLGSNLAVAFDELTTRG